MSISSIELKSTGRFVGIFLMLALVSNLVGSELLDAIVTAPDYLSQAFPARSSMVMGMLFELISAASVVGVLVLVYGALKKVSPKLALAYFCFRLLEPGITIAIILAAMAVLSASGQYISAGGGDSGYFGVVGQIFLDIRNWALMIYIVIFSLGAVLFYTLLLKSRAVPLLFPIWGFIGVALLFGGSLFEMFGFNVDPLIYGIVAGLNEIALGIWLTVRGFSGPLAQN